MHFSYALAPFWLHLGVLWFQAFLWAPFGTPFWLPLAFFRLPSAHFLLPLGAVSLCFALARALSVCSGVLLVHFGRPCEPRGFKWQLKCSQSCPGGTKTLQRSYPRLPRFWEHPGVVFILFCGSGIDSYFHLVPILVQISSSFAYVKKVYSSIVPYSIFQGVFDSRDSNLDAPSTRWGIIFVTLVKLSDRCSLTFFGILNLFVGFGTRQSIKRLPLAAIVYSFIENHRRKHFFATSTFHQSYMRGTGPALLGKGAKPS